jgi:hypothetical protein
MAAEIQPTVPHWPTVTISVWSDGVRTEDGGRRTENNVLSYCSVACQRPSAALNSSVVSAHLLFLRNAPAHLFSHGGQMGAMVTWTGGTLTKYVHDMVPWRNPWLHSALHTTHCSGTRKKGQRTNILSVYCHLGSKIRYAAMRIVRSSLTPNQG